MGDLFKGYVMASEFAGWIADGRLECAKSHLKGKYDSMAHTAMLMHGLGYVGIEVAPFTTGVALDADEKGHKQRIDAVIGGSVAGLHWILSFLNKVKPEKEGLSIFSYAEKKMETFEYYKLLIDHCTALGGTYMVHGSPPSRKVPDKFLGDPLHAAAHFCFQACGIVVCRYKSWHLACTRTALRH